MRNPNHSQRAGQALVIMVSAVVILVVVAALTIDIGQLIFSRARLQNASDAAALAAAHELVLRRDAGVTETNARTAAAAEAFNLVQLNWIAPRAEVYFGKYESGQFTPMDESYTASAIKVITFRDDLAPGGPVGAVFGSMMGIDELSIEGAAVSQLARGITAITGDLRPFAVHKDDIKPAGQIFRIPLGNWTVSEDGEEIAPGNFGLLNLNGGALGTDELITWIQNGYDGTCSIDPDVGYTWIPGTCGVRQAIVSEIEALIGQMVFVCVYDMVTGEGSNATFRIIWFAGGIIRDIKFAGPNSYIEVEMVRLSYVPQAEVGDVPDSNLVKIQLVQ